MCIKTYVFNAEENNDGSFISRQWPRSVVLFPGTCMNARFFLSSRLPGQ